MAEIKDIIAYILKAYPHKHELANARVTKIAYLADWHQAITNFKQISPIYWYFDNYGPYVSDIKTVALKHPELFSVSQDLNVYGGIKLKFALADENYIPKISDKERESIDHIISETKNLFWDEFIKLVYSTYPIASSDRYTYLNLIEKAHEYTGHP